MPICIQKRPGCCSPDRSAHALLCCVRSFARLDGHEAEELGEERDEDDRDQDGRDVLDHDAPCRTPAEWRRGHDLFLDDLRLDAPTNEDAGQERHDRHHDGVRDEVEEVEQRSAGTQRLDERKAVVAQIHEHGRNTDDHEREHSCLLARAFRAVMHDRNASLHERDRRGERCENNEQEEQHADNGCEIAERCEHLRQHDEHETGARILSNCLRRTQCNERCWHDHEARQERNANIKASNTDRARGERIALLHVGTIGDHDAHRDREREEHLPQRRNHEFYRERGEIRHQIICRAIKCARLAERIDDQDDGHDDERWHHDQVRLLDASLDAARHDEEHNSHEDEEPDIRLETTGDEAGEVGAAITDRGRWVEEIGTDVLRHPATDHAIVRRDDEGNERSQDADEGVLLSEQLERADGGLAGLAAERDLDEQQRKTKGEHKHQVGEQEHTATVLRRQIREAPQITQADRRSGCSQDECPFA